MSEWSASKKRRRLGVLLPCLLFLFSCVHFQVDRYPQGLGSHSRPWIAYPAKAGAILGLPLGAILSLALSPLSLPLGYLLEGRGGVLAALLLPLLYTSYFTGTCLSTPFFLAWLPFAPHPLEDKAPERRFYALQYVREYKQKKYLKKVQEILLHDLWENRVEAAKTFGTLAGEKETLWLLKRWKSSSGKERYLFSLALQYTAREEMLPFWHRLAKGKGEFAIFAKKLLKSFFAQNN